MDVSEFNRAITTLQSTLDATNTGWRVQPFGGDDGIPGVPTHVLGLLCAFTVRDETSYGVTLSAAAVLENTSAQAEYAVGWVARVAGRKE